MAYIRNDYRNNNKYTHKEPRRNEFIRVPQVRLIDETEQNVGIVDTEIALKQAKEVGLDLIEVSPNADPPVAKIMDYSKYIYEQKKKARKGNVVGKQKEMKEYKFSPVIEDNDITFKVKRAKHYLSKGHAVRITMERKGRQTQEIADLKLAEILTNFEGYSSIEPDPVSEGKRKFITFKPDGKTEKQKNSIKETEADKPEGKQEG